MISRSRRDLVGGGVRIVAEFSRHLHQPTRFSGGGGSSRMFPCSPDADARFGGGGGGSSRIFPSSPVAISVVYPTFRDVLSSYFLVLSS